MKKGLGLVLGRLRLGFSVLTSTSTFPSGFTLIELLVVIGVMGILTAIAIPQFIQYRKGAFDAAAKSDLRNAAIAAHAYFSINGVYSAEVDDLKNNGFRATPGVNLKITVAPSKVDFNMSSHAAQCAPGSGEWNYSTMSGRIEGTNCQ